MVSSVFSFTETQIRLQCLFSRPLFCKLILKVTSKSYESFDIFIWFLISVTLWILLSFIDSVVIRSVEVLSRRSNRKYYLLILDVSSKYQVEYIIWRIFLNRFVRSRTLDVGGIFRRLEFYVKYVTYQVILFKIPTDVVNYEANMLILHDILISSTKISATFVFDTLGMEEGKSYLLYLRMSDSINFLRMTYLSKVFYLL